MKAISFLGTAPYQLTHYHYGDKECETEYFVETLPVFFPDLEQVLVLLTPTVQRHENWAKVQARLGTLVKPVPIPEGHSETELWEIFKALTDTVDDGETVVFDITNSFRSLPFLTFLAAAMLRTARQVNVQRIVYGAYEARDIATNRTPVFDLTPFVTLLDWLTATNQFIYTGNARYLAHLLEESQRPPLDHLAEQVDAIAMGLHLLRPLQVSQSASQLPDALTEAQEVLPLPFALLSKRLSQEYGQFGKGNLDDPWLLLYHQWQMINWYHRTDQIVHTLSMGREWLVSLLCVHFGVDTHNMYERGQLELLLSGGKNPQTGEESKYLARWDTVLCGKRLRKLWGAQPYNLANVRNDVLHSGFRKNPKPAQEIVALTAEIVEELNEIAKVWRISERTPTSVEIPLCSS